jgi:hypothetical protein
MELIRAIKCDIIDFKRSSPIYSDVDWILPATTCGEDRRGNFVRDYMQSRGYTENFEFYNQLMYVVMCNNWEYPKEL